ncbi:hypothetical protein ADEAN_000097900 [Angomonas deanei]|uniref:Uncharacterized protein n=1 Tax=Angomonas deanei TaxID=59799 RepID=A0A7G2C1N6_9TRYP|nr:hypothetical protein ADEAN_000097900 [Angomonas deanei]
MEVKSEMITVPVQKKRKYTEDLTPRFVCFDPSTRMIYMSDKAENIRNWKHRMRVYAVNLNRRSLTANIRDGEVKARDVLAIEVNGVTHHRLSADAAGRVENSQLPNLADYSQDYTGGNADASWGTYVEGTYMNKPSNEPVNIVEDKCFFDKERFDWELRFDQYAPYHDLFMCIRDVLIADGLREAVCGGLPNYVDPRNQLHLAPIPLHLSAAFISLKDSIVYTCIHTEMIGCNNRGELGVCMKHCYVCLTDKDVLFMAEDGSVGRCIPFAQLQALEYNVEGPKSFLSFLTNGSCADVLVSPADMCKRNADASPSMVKAMPWCNPKKDGEAIRRVLDVVINAAKPESDADSYDDDLDILDNNNKPAKADVSTNGKLAIKTVSENLTEYAESFNDAHGRIFKWQPLPGYKGASPTVQPAEAIAKAHNVVLPRRQEITKRPEFKEFYISAIPVPTSQPGSAKKGESNAVKIPTTKEITGVLNPVPKR